MSYSVKEIFYTLQGEGANTGRPAVFCRFSGCNLWSGHEADRLTAVCQFCDTDFVGINGEGGGRFTTASELSRTIASKWPDIKQGNPLVVCSGGEPLLQLDACLIDEIHSQDFEIAVETNGTLEAPAGIDWLCVSPKAGADLILKKGNELKLIYPQPGAEPEKYEDLEFEHFFLQPMDGRNLQNNTQLAVAYCLEHPTWRLSLQTHKLIGIP